MNRSEKTLGVIILIVMLALIAVFSYFIIAGQLKQGDEKLYHKIEVSSELSDHQKTLDMVAEFLVDYRNSPYINKVRIVAAKTLLEKHENQKARDYAIKVIRDTDKSDEFVSAVMVLGELLVRTQKYDSVILAYLENAYLKASDPEKQKLADALGTAYYLKKDYAAALDKFQEAADEDAMIGEIKVYLVTQKYNMAINKLEDYFARYSASTRFEQEKSFYIKVCYQLASSQQKTKRYQEAVKNYLKIVNRFRNDRYSDLALLQIAKIYDLNHKYDVALDFYQKVLNNNVHNGDEEALFRTAVLYYQTAKKAKALNLFQNLVSKYPNGDWIRKAYDWINLLNKEMQLD